jgi:hypothetical protein
VLSAAPPAVLASSSAGGEETVLRSTTAKHVHICQGDETLPRGTRFVRSSIEAYTGSRLEVQALQGSRVITSGELGAGWGGRGVAIPVSAVDRTFSGVTVCFSSRSIDEPLAIYGVPAGRQPEASSSESAPVGGRMRIAYLGSGHSSWLSLVPSIARHMGLGHAWSGTWVAPFVVMLMLAATALAARVILKESDE